MGLREDEYYNLSRSGLGQSQVDRAVRNAMARHLRFEHEYSIVKIQQALHMSRKDVKIAIGEEA